MLRNSARLLLYTKRNRGTTLLSLGLLSATGIAQDTKSKSSHIFRTPPPSAPRAVPTPLVFVSSKAWDNMSHKGVTSTASMLTERGYTCLEVDIDLPHAEDDTTSSESAMKFYESELARQVRLAGIPFPPVIFARSAAALIAQQYVSSNPASGLVLISPPTSNAALTQTSGGLPFEPSSLKEFDFEARFPVVIVESRDRQGVQRKENRLVRDEGVDMIVVEDVDAQEALVKIELWLDENGI